MTYKEFKEKAFAYSKKIGIEACQINYQNNKNFSLSLGNGELEKYQDASSYKITLKVLKDGKIGSAFSESLEDAEKIVDEAYENLKLIDSEEINYFYDGKGKYLEMNTYSGKFEEMEVNKKLEFVNNIHKEISNDEKIAMVPMVVYQEIGIENKLSNTYGLDLENKMDGAFSYAMAVAKDTSPRSGVDYIVASDPSKLTLDFAKNVKKFAIEKIGSKSVKSGKYDVVFLNSAFSDVLGMFNHMLSAENIQKGLSPLKGKLNSKIGSNKLNIKDLAYYDGSISNTPFDSEGVPTKDKVILEDGILKTYLYDLKTAKKDKVEPTGNSISGRITYMNLFVEPGINSYEELLKKVNNGIVITEVEGMHSGANPISGDFSLGAQGLLIENGKIIRGVEQITISGNFLDMLSKVSEIGNDMKIGQNIVNPSVIIKQMDIAGNI
ncbi:peptidase U62 [Tepiditoga spiralis]|uniref:Peptidase U62 n=1 Tax=Tepiditoga spiralis TaxID=2108365 RepID=A0A7G1G804_9BACT|nr:TldD/PmbA family protein [Tepiditoga spiralis]BBE31033.1 peptidase U62 [Tepiditoga spiralis]